jgi:hypothetical protein
MTQRQASSADTHVRWSCFLVIHWLDFSRLTLRYEHSSCIHSFVTVIQCCPLWALSLASLVHRRRVRGSIPMVFSCAMQRCTGTDTAVLATAIAYSVTPYLLPHPSAIGFFLPVTLGTFDQHLRLSLPPSTIQRMRYGLRQSQVLVTRRLIKQ